MQIEYSKKQCLGFINELIIAEKGILLDIEDMRSAIIELKRLKSKQIENFINNLFRSVNKLEEELYRVRKLKSALYKIIDIYELTEESVFYYDCYVSISKLIKIKSIEFPKLNTNLTDLRIHINN